MIQNQINQKNSKWNIIIIISSIIGLITCIAVLFLPVRLMIINWAIQILHKELISYDIPLNLLFSYAMGGICFILLFDYYALTKSGRAAVQEIKDCLSEIDYKFFLKPVLLMFVIYSLGIFTIIRANFLYIDDIKRSIEGCRGWSDWSRYVSEFLSIFVHADTNITDISPLPQLLAVLIMSLSSVLLVYIIGNRRISIIMLIASTPLTLSPYFLECLVFKFDAPYFALSILASIIPFLFITRRKAFLLVSVVSLLIMCMTYQSASGIYILIAIFLCFQDWNRRQKTNKEILSFIGISVVAFCFAMLFFKFFLMKPYLLQESGYASNAMHPVSHIIPGTLSNIKNYAMTINNDFGIIWKIGILMILLFFIIQSTYSSAQKKIFSFSVSIMFIGLSFILSFGVYSLLEEPTYFPRSLFGFSVFIAILCVYIADYKKITTFAVLALNWCFFVFAFSYGNALADQARYAEFRIGLLLHDLSTLYPNADKEDLPIQLLESIDYAPTIKNISKHYPVIEKLVPKRLGNTYSVFDYLYLMGHFNYKRKKPDFGTSINYDNMDLPVVLDSYYHTIKSDGEHTIVILKH